MNQSDRPDAYVLMPVYSGTGEKLRYSSRRKIEGAILAGDFERFNVDRIESHARFRHHANCTRANFQLALLIEADRKIAHSFIILMLTRPRRSKNGSRSSSTRSGSTPTLWRDAELRRMDTF